jgi:hypothetical protein
MPGYSKGAQGLSVYVRVTGIFTGTTDSPSALRRQCPNHYAIRAGRNFVSGVRGLKIPRLPHSTVSRGTDYTFT